MEQHGITPDVSSFNALMSACEKRGQWEKVIALFYEMKRQAIVPDAKSFSVTLSACEQGAITH